MRIVALQTRQAAASSSASNNAKATTRGATAGWPGVRFFPTTATVDNWLASSPLTPTAPQTAAQSTAQSTGRYSAVTAGGDHSCGLRTNGTNGTITCWGKWAFHTA